MTVGRRITPFVVAAMCAVVAVGCAESPEAGTVAGEPEPARTTTAAAVREKTSPLEQRRTSAITTVMKWMDASNRARRTLDPAPFLALSDSNCKACGAFASRLRAMKRNGGRFTGQYLDQVLGYSAEPDMVPPRVVVKARSGKFTYSSRSGAEPLEEGPAKYEIRIDLKWEDGEWLIAEYKAVADRSAGR